MEAAPGSGEDAPLDEIPVNLSLDEVDLSSDDELVLDEPPGLSTGPKEDTAETEELLPDDIPLDDTAFDENSIDLSNAVIDEPDLGPAIQDTPLEEPSLDDISLDDLDDLGDKISLDPQPDYDSGAGQDASAPEAAVPIDLDLEDELDLEETVNAPGETEEELELPADIPLPEEESPLPPEFAAEAESRGSPPEFAAEAEGRGSPPEEESFAQVIPEGFIVEGEDAPVSDDDGLETGLPAFGEPDTGPETVEKIPVAEPVLPEREEAADDAGIPDEAPLDAGDISSPFKQELKTVLSYMDQLLESLPENKIEEFAKSEYFDTYKKLFKELGIV
jgi:hypothetical protein